MFRKKKVEVPEGYKLATFPVTRIKLYVPEEFSYRHIGPVKSVAGEVIKLDIESRKVSGTGREYPNIDELVGGPLVPEVVQYTVLSNSRRGRGIPQASTLYRHDFLDFEGAFVGGMGELGAIIDLGNYFNRDPRDFVIENFWHNGLDLSKIERNDQELMILGGFLGLINQRQISVKKGARRLTTSPRILSEDDVKKYDDILKEGSLKKIGPKSAEVYGVGRHDPRDQGSVMNRNCSDRSFRSYGEKKKQERDQNGVSLKWYEKPIDFIDNFAGQIMSPKNRFRYFVGKEV